ncbi:hypothetical protein DIS24_g12013 [Lasiodiplodia hormozganensis]|uniref:Uncharacterized protein n=1 Tax=Lasiodiplodia hormozganensis TaxID=869390 RepID=A0AA39TIG9_9PEZI|nr:hypothetical protein DIS24_g12013 [Lasiodiplodia hormozganensis]
MMPPNETREQAAARFQAAFWEHQDERTPHNKNDPAGKKNTHKHLPTRAQLAEWVDALKDGTEAQFASGQERHWAKTYLRLEGEDVFWKSSGNGGVPDMKVLCLEEWALRIFDAHVADEAVHRGRDATYEWLRDPAGGCKKPQDAPAGTVLYKAPMKEVVMTFISGCPVCKAKCSSGSSSNSKKRKGAPSPTDDDDNNNNNQQDASPRPQKKRATRRRVPVAPAVPAAAPAAPSAPANLAGFADLLAGPAGPADSADLFRWNDRGLPFRVEENLPVQGSFSYDLANAAPAPAPAPGLVPAGGFGLEDGLIDPALLQVGPYAEPEATESLQLVNTTLGSAPVPLVPLSDEELGIEVDRAIWADFLSLPNREPDISNLQDVNIPNQEFNFSNEELNSSNLQDANSSNEELNFSGLQDASSSDEELDFSNLEESDYIDWDCFTS